jgi:hypothetical protein
MTLYVIVIKARISGVSLVGTRTRLADANKLAQLTIREFGDDFETYAKGKILSIEDRATVYIFEDEPDTDRQADLRRAIDAADFPASVKRGGK